MPMTRLKQRRSARKRGFTLVELIVVIAILAVLAAILVPTLVGYVDRSKQQTANSDAKSAFIAVTTIVATGTGKPTSNTLVLWNNAITDRLSPSAGTITALYFYSDGSCAGITWQDANGKDGSYGAQAIPDGGSAAT